MMDLLKLIIEKLRGLKTYNERIRRCKIEIGLQIKIKMGPWPHFFV